MNDEDPEIARQAIVDAVENQIESNDPPETAQTLERLKKEGYPREEALKLIGSVLAAEMFSIMKEGREYNHDEYIKALEALPKLPWD
ncbi:hypothetical protein [Salinisphaera sp. LB1]|uniref:hypothetical protein n=1 Tax=Salinisphaera sp. LB1 TaxID=2183911 RepID=UPI000D708DE9|nr:hypothetical protein [Salinisphaera sp. LB1]